MTYQPTSVPASTSSAPSAQPTATSLPLSMSQKESQKGLGKDANQAFEKFANMDLLGSSTKRANPFETGPSLSSLAEMNAGKATSSNPIVQASSSFEKKPIMKNTLSPPNPGNASMVLSSNQQGNWGGYSGTVGGAPVMNSAPAPILGHGYSQSGYVGYSMYGAQQQQQQQQQQPAQQQQFQTPTPSGPPPSYYGQGYAAPPPARGNPW
jgi:hypothetical protein